MDDPMKQLMLANQYEILSRLDPKNDEWPKALDRVIRGFPLAGITNFDWIAEAVADPFEPNEIDLVHDILDLYALLQSALQGTPDENNSIFEGFDGNNETSAMAYFRILRNEGKWMHVKIHGTNINSHCQTYPRYSNMIADWKALGSPVPLTVQQAKDILKIV